jgi:hypothetical protein
VVGTKLLAERFFEAESSFHPFFLGIVAIEEVIDVMAEMERNKLRDVIFRVFLHAVRQLRK